MLPFSLNYFICVLKDGAFGLYLGFALWPPPPFPDDPATDFGSSPPPVGLKPAGRNLGRGLELRGSGFFLNKLISFYRPCDLFSCNHTPLLFAFYLIVNTAILAHRGIRTRTTSFWTLHYFFLFLGLDCDALIAFSVGAPFSPFLRMRSPLPALMRFRFWSMLYHKPFFLVVFFAMLNLVS